MEVFEFERTLLRRELNISEQMINFYVIRTIDILVDQGTAYIVQPLMDMYLRDYLLKGAISEEMHQDIFSKILHVLSYMHTKRLMHRDTKLDNLLVMVPTKPEEEIDVRICDFGHAKKQRLVFIRKYDRVSGTIGYRAPEGIGLRLNTTKLYIWSVGVVFYVMMNGGDLPYSGRDHEAIDQDFTSEHEDYVDASEESKDFCISFLKEILKSV